MHGEVDETAVMLMQNFRRFRNHLTNQNDGHIRVMLELEVIAYL